MKKLLGLLLIVLTLGASSQTTTPISQLPTAGALSGSELVPVVQSGVTKKTTLNNIIGKVDSAFLSTILTAYLRKSDTTSFYDFANQMLRIIDTIGKWQQQGRYMVNFSQHDDSITTFRFSDSTDKDMILRIALTAENITAIQNINNYLDSLRGPDSTQIVIDNPYSHLQVYATYDSVGHIDSLHFFLDTVTTTHGGTLTAAQYNALLAAAGGGTVVTVTASSPVHSSGGASPNITIDNAAADGSTKGAASFAANDFNSSSGNISTDYTNGQAASGSTKGYLTAADWTTFNNKLSSESDPKRLTTLAVTGTTTKTITATLADASTVTTTFTDNDSGGATGVYQEIISTAGQLVFSFTTVPATAAKYMVYRNGEGVPKRFYSISGNDVTFVSGITLNDSIILQGVQ